MARISSPVWSIIRGSIAGTTYFANQYHQIVARARTAPTNPNTTNQALIRTAFASAVDLYEDLTDQQRQDWKDYADTLTYQGPLGPYTVPGREVMVGNIGTRIYMTNRGRVFTNPDYLAPTRPGFLTFEYQGTLAPGAPGTGFRVQVFNNSPESISVYAFRSFAFDPSRRRFKGPFLSASFTALDLPVSDGGFIDFTGLEENLVYFVKLRAISESGHARMAAPQIIRAVAEETV